MQSLSQTIHSCVEEAQAGMRLDAYVARRWPQISRSHVKKLCDQGAVLLGGVPAKPASRVCTGDEITVHIPAAQPVQAQPQPIPLDVVYEDSDLIVINKPRGMVVHPAAGNTDGTLVNALLHHCEDLSGIAGQLRPGIVHRLDKDTTGLLVCAKNDTAHRGLAAQIADKSAQRIYLALVEGNLTQPSGVVDQPLGRSMRDRKQIAVMPGGLNAATEYTVVERFGNYTLLQLRLRTGRTHQIRVHMKHIGHPVVGDPVYGIRKQRFKLAGQLLHATRLAFTHPRTGAALDLHAPLPVDFAALLQRLRANPAP